MVNNELEHNGIMGMKWGHKKASGWSPTNATSAAKKQVAKVASKVGVKEAIKKVRTRIPNSDDHVKTTAIKGKAIRTLSNAQLKTFNERVQLEQTYKQLTKNSVSPGRKMVQDMLANTAKQTVQVYLSKGAIKGVEMILNKATASR